MFFRIPFKFPMTPVGFTTFYAAYHGLAYYAHMLLVSGILPFNKGYFRIVLNAFLLLPACLFYFKSLYKGNRWVGTLPFAVQVFILYYLWTGLSFFWADSQGFILQGVDVKLNYFGLWLNSVFEFLIIFLLCQSASIERIAINYLRGVRIGGAILAVTMLVFWIFGAKDGRLGFFNETATIILPNWAAIKFATAILCSMHLFFSQSGRRRKDLLLFSAMTLPMLLALFLTVGKTAILGFGLAFVCYIITAKMPWKLRGGLLFSLVLVVLGVFPFVAGYLETYIEHGTYLTLTDRTTLWTLIMEKVAESPVIGHGIGSPFPTMWWNKAGFTGEGHNEYLNALFSTGSIGLLIVITIFFSPLITAFKVRRHSLFQPHFPFFLSIFVLMFTFSLTASSPVGFFVPLEFLMVNLLWVSEKWRRKEPVMQFHKNPALLLPKHDVTTLSASREPVTHA